MGMGKSLVRLFIVALLVCPWQQAMAADPCAEGKLRPATIVDGNKLLLKWSGTVNEGMGPAIAAAFDAYKLRTKIGRARRCSPAAGAPTTWRR